MQSYTVYLYLETALHVSSCTSTHHQEHIQVYQQRTILNIMNTNASATRVFGAFNHAALHVYMLKFPVSRQNSLYSINLLVLMRVVYLSGALQTGFLPNKKPLIIRLLGYRCKINHGVKFCSV